MKIVRCAIYARKSSEEGLEQDFNSLDAQREACEAYVKSQTNLGWRAIAKRYEDGGFSGGTLERPGLQNLLADLRNQRIDVIVIYKIDRLTRSLSDFARLADLFEVHQVSFVSVTQQFNTATSMGRLMLNVLLSFAQFEREITGERIRDKISASKKKGMWMGGLVPLGYDRSDRALIVNREEAEIVRSLFEKYLEIGSITGLQQFARNQGWRTKQRVRGDGSVAGGKAFSRGHLHRILSNPLYRGEIAHRGRCYPGRHAAIIDAATYTRVQALLASNRQDVSKRTNGETTGLLLGWLKDLNGQPYTQSHTKRHGKRYRYYVLTQAGSSPGDRPVTSKGGRLPAGQLEELFRRNLAKILNSKKKICRLLDTKQSARSLEQAISNAKLKAQEIGQQSNVELRDELEPVVRSVTYSGESMEMRISPAGFGVWLGCRSDLIQNSQSKQTSFPCEIRKRGRQLKVIDGPSDIPATATPDPTLVKVLKRAHAWRMQLEDKRARPISHLAKANGVNASYFTRILRLAYLSPDITEAILEGRQPADLTASRLVRIHNLPIDWAKQRQQLGFQNT